MRRFPDHEPSALVGVHRDVASAADDSSGGTIITIRKTVDVRGEGELYQLSKLENVSIGLRMIDLWYKSELP